MPASAKRILIAPLDWGLGHTTRCIPIIRALASLGHKVVFAGDINQQAFIRKTFPQIDVQMLEGYRVRYSRRALMFTLLWQLPRLLNTIKAEHRWLQALVEKEGIDGIISDNRYGLWHPQKPSVILTHQPGIITGMGAWTDAIIRKMHYRMLERFGAVWIPDVAGVQNLAGKLAHPSPLPARAAYIGWLSQFHRKENGAKLGSHILILLSGPEPQRTIIADRLWTQAACLERPIVFVDGKAVVIRKNIPPHIRHYTLADAATLQPLLEEALLVICRSGYSTLMDLALLGKEAILIPTPGQTEQEYLASSLAERGSFYTVTQKGLALGAAIQGAENFREHAATSLQAGQDQLLPVLQEWLQKL